MIRLGKFDKQGYKDSFSKGELARELVCMNNDYDKLEKENQKYKEVIDKAKKLHNEFASKNSLLIFENNNLIDFMNNLINILKEVEHDS